MSPTRLFVALSVLVVVGLFCLASGSQHLFAPLPVTTQPFLLSKDNQSSFSGASYSIENCQPNTEITNKSIPMQMQLIDHLSSPNQVLLENRVSDFIFTLGLFAVAGFFFYGGKDQ